ncbi:MAG: hypothetical protein WC873_00110 [Candidatus Gracilibacteria bacterium]
MFIIGIIADPITAISAFLQTASTCSFFEIPKPTASGSLICFFTFFKYGLNFGFSVAEPPVVPYRDTQYTNPRAFFAIIFSRLSGVSGEITGIAFNPYFPHVFR